MADLYSGLIQIVAKIGNDVVSKTVSKTGGSQPRCGKSLAAAVAGTLTTRTNDTQGIVTSTAHGLTDADVVAIFWDTGKAYDCTISSYNANTFTFTVTGDQSDALPAIGTTPPALTIAVAEDVTQDVSIDGDNLELVMAKATSITADALIVLYDGTTAEVFACEDLGAATPYIWPQTSAELADGAPFTETVVKVRFYNGDTVAGQLELIALS